jgi:hypothetical protein
MNDPVPAAFAQQYGVPADMRMWQAIKAAIQDPFTQEKWNALLEDSRWFAAEKSFIPDEMKLFRGTKHLAVATYTFEQGSLMTRNFVPTKPPWVLNCVYARRTVRETPGAPAPTNPYWLQAIKQLGPD